MQFTDPRNANRVITALSGADRPVTTPFPICLSPDVLVFDSAVRSDVNSGMPARISMMNCIIVSSMYIRTTFLYPFLKWLSLFMNDGPGNSVETRP